MNRQRIAIAGGGPVGLALACACSGFDVRVVEAAAPHAPVGDELDLRVYALSAGTRSFLQALGAWEFLDASRIAPVRRMEVFGDKGARLSFGAGTGGALAWIVEAGRLNAALESLARSLPFVSLTSSSEVIECAASAEGGWLTLASGELVAADLLVGADGPDSRVRSMLGLAASESRYEETAIVAHFESQADHGGTARQWFRPDGVLAWLPLPGRRISIVWSAPLAAAEALVSVERAEFERRVRDAGNAILGDLRLLSPVARFPLRMIQVERTVAPGVALIGDAAHTVHPLAGQGVNLGFQDARALSSQLAAMSPLERPGDLRVLRRYARERREDVTSMQFVTDRLDRLFADRRPGAAALRNFGLRAVESAPFVKAALATRAMR